MAFHTDNGTFMRANDLGHIAQGLLGFGPFYGGTQTDAYRKQLNEFIRTSGIFDGVIDFEAAVLDPATGAMMEVFTPNSDGGPGDWLHPNRIGLQAMGAAIDLSLLNLDK